MFDDDFFLTPLPVDVVEICVVVMLTMKSKLSGDGIRDGCEMF